MNTKKLLYKKWDVIGWDWSYIKDLWREWYYRYVLAKCSCGKVKKVNLYNIRNWNSFGCGCKIAEKSRQSNLKHWMHKHPLYRTWWSMMKRCYNEDCEEYKNYWWRWIIVHDRWHDVRLFIKDMYGDHKKWLTLDRVDNDWNYCRENCRWTTRSKQMRNTRKSRDVTIDWQTKNIHDWSEMSWVNAHTIRYRIINWWKPKDAVFTPAWKPPK